MSRRPDIVWQNPLPATEQAAVAAALAQPGLVDTTLARLYGDGGAGATFSRFTIRHLATGGAKRVYLIHAMAPDGRMSAFVLKQFLPIRLAYLPPGATIAGMTGHAAELDARLLQPTFESHTRDRMIFQSREAIERCYPPGLVEPHGLWVRWSGEVDEGPSNTNP